jgi:carbamate kinase
MRPKFEACAGYAESTGNPVLITDVDHLKEGRDGTWITG